MCRAMALRIRRTLHRIRHHQLRAIHHHTQERLAAHILHRRHVQHIRRTLAAVATINLC